MNLIKFPTALAEDVNFQFTEDNLKSLETQTGLKFAGQDITDVITRALNYVFTIAGILLLVYLLYGGYQLMISSSNPKKAEEARSIITNALLGFVIIFISFWAGPW